MPVTVNIHLDTRVLDSLIKNLDGNVGQAVAKAAFTVEAKAKVRAPVDTGALRASIYVSMAGMNEEAGALAQAQALRPEAQAAPLPVPRDSQTAHIGPSVEYAEAVELGTSRRSGHPYLQPAFRETEEDMKNLLRQAVNGG